MNISRVITMDRSAVAVNELTFYNPIFAKTVAKAAATALSEA